jgi:serine/threonine-protein kinase
VQRRVDRLRSFLTELAPEPEAGTQVGPHVQLTRRIGEGGMGAVWLGEHLTLGVEVAVKVLAARWLDSPLMLERFAEEARAGARIQSAHVVRVLDHGFYEGDLPYLVMEKLEGEDVAKRLERDGVLPLEDATQLVVQACRGLAAAQAAGIVHRDIKPSNLFLAREDAREVVKILDFGIAKRIDVPSGTATTTRHSWGTPRYMSPEQLVSPKSVDHCTDLWSLAVVAYECLTGAIPFEGETIAALAVAMERGRFTLPSEVRPELPRGLDGFFRRAFARDPDERFAEPSALARAWLEAVARPRPARGRWPAVGLMAALALGAVLAATAIGGDDEPAPAPSPAPSEAQGRLHEPIEAPAPRAPATATPSVSEPPAPPPRPHVAPPSAPPAAAPPEPALPEAAPPEEKPPRKNRGF